jgi:hypothetical protein
MTQFSLIDEDPSLQTLQTVGIAGSPKTLSKAQKQFNKHIATIEATMREIEQWRAFLPIYPQYVADRLTPLEAQLRERRIAMAKLLDRHMSGKALSRTQREKARDLLLNLLGGLLDERESAELIQLHDQHSDINFDQYEQQDGELIRTFAEDIFGIKLDDGVSPEELMEQFHRKAGEREEKERAKRERQRERRNNTKKAAQPAKPTTVIQDATRAVRDIYRKLASELHPDREQDPQRRVQLTELMQQANRAYEDDDLLTLLKLQMQVEQIDPQALSQIAQARLDSYNHVLREQSDRLKRELLDLKVPFASAIGLHKLTPQAVQKAIDADEQELRNTLQQLDDDLATFEDVRQLKKWLKDYRIEAPDDFDIEMLLRG